MYTSQRRTAAGLLVTASLAACIAIACVIPNPYIDDCFHHCWMTSVTLEEDEYGYVPGAQCPGKYSGSVAIPAPGSLVGKACLEFQAEQDSINAVIYALSNDTLGSLTQEQRQAWSSLVDRLADDANASCLAYVTGSPSGTDIDPQIGGVQVCTDGAMSQAVCDSMVGAAIRARYDLSNAGNTETPEYAGAKPGVSGEPTCSFEPQYDSTGDVDPSSSDGGGADESSSTDGNASADSSGGETSGFGDVDGRIECSSSTSCTVDASLLRDIADGFTTFYAEGVVLSIISGSAPCNTAGAVLSGLDAGDDAKALADAIGLRNGDIIAVVEGIQLSSMDKAADIIDDLSSSSDPISMTVKRRANNSCRSFNLTLTIQ